MESLSLHRERLGTLRIGLNDTVGTVSTQLNHSPVYAMAEPVGESTGTAVGRGRPRTRQKGRTLPSLAHALARTKYVSQSIHFLACW